MGAAASMPAARAGAWEAGIPHATRVTRLYRASLRTSRDWLIDREVWLVDAARIQKAFHSQKGLSVAAGRVLADRAAETLIEHRHPEPYVPIYMEGGSSYQRNVPPPPELTEQSMPPPEHAFK